jgi:hypothetical protein
MCRHILRESAVLFTELGKVRRCDLVINQSNKALKSLKIANETGNFLRSPIRTVPLCPHGVRKIRDGAGFTGGSAEVVEATRNEIRLRNGVVISIHSNSFRTSRFR